MNIYFWNRANFPKENFSFASYLYYLAVPCQATLLLVELTPEILAKLFDNTLEPLLANVERRSLLPGEKAQGLLFFCFVPFCIGFSSEVSCYFRFCVLLKCESPFSNK